MTFLQEYKDTEWQPFVKGLSGVSIKKSLKILDSFFNYLVQTHYLLGNPLAVDRRRKRRQEKPRIIDRYLELDEIQAVLKALSNYTRLRISEAVNLKMGNFIQRENNWFLRVIGQGKKLREIPIPDELLIVLGGFRTEIGLFSPQPKFREETPLITMQNLKQSIGVESKILGVRYTNMIGHGVNVDNTHS